jgi:hypothetical protein
MPVHRFTCRNPDCKHDFIDYFKMSTVVPERVPCPKCHLMSAVREFPQTHTHKDFSKPVQHYACAPVNHEDVMALRNKLPADIEMSTDPQDELYGIPISRNETQRQQVLKAAGHVDKGRSK